MEEITTKKGPSRAECENIIRRILMTEVLEKGTNEHFRNASDFMSYFQSLYPAGPALTKQVQRAVKSMEMPKDEKGYFIINKTKDQLGEDQEISFLLKKCQGKLVELPVYENVFLSVQPECKEYLFQQISQSSSFKDKFVTMIDTSNGILFLTENKAQLQILINSLINR